MLFMPCTLNFVLQHLRARSICAQVGCSDNVLPGLCDDNEGVEVALYLVQAYGHCFIFSLPYVLALGLSCLAQSGCIP